MQRFQRLFIGGPRLSVHQRLYATKAPSPSSASSPFDIISSRSSATSQEDLDIGPTPEGVSQDFYVKYRTLLHRLPSIKDLKTLSVQSLADSVTSESDATLFSDALVKLQQASPTSITLTDGFATTDLLLEHKAYESLLTLLFDRRKYALSPTPEQLGKLMDGLYEDFKATAKSSTDSSKLDNLYKCFAVYLYSDICPSQAQYEILVEAGLVGLEDAKRRSLRTLLEMISLGYDTTKYSADLLAEAKNLDLSIPLR